MFAAVANLRRTLSEHTSTIKARSRHFVVLSIVFLFPIALCTFIYPSPINSRYLQSLYFSSTPNPKNPYILLLQILNTLIISFFSICALAWITYGIAHGYYGTPVEIISSLRSILSLFLPLLATLVVRHIIFGLISTISYNGLLYFGIDDFDYMVIACLLVGALIYLQCEWYVSSAIVVVESQCGFSPLEKSSYLVMGLMEKVVFPMILFCGAFGGLLSFITTCLVANGSGSFEVMEVALLTVVYTGCLMILSLYSVVSNTVMFMHCKLLHQEEFGHVC